MPLLQLWRRVVLIQLAAVATVVSSSRCAVLALAASTPNPKANPTTSAASLQDPHGRRRPSQVLQEMVDYLKNHEGSGSDDPIDWDVYGDFDKDASSSFMRKLEAELAAEVGMEDAVFMPSGVMAQSIALLIHQKNKRKRSSMEAPSALHFICHETSHLLLHEHDAYRELARLEPLVVSTQNKVPEGEISIPAMTFADVQDSFVKHHPQDEDTHNTVVALLVELPHRELGGKLTPWEDLVQMRRFCQEHEIAFHCDGARLFEATTGCQKTLKEIAALFDSVYVSSYKGLGSPVSGAWLLGTHAFCQEARTWLRRFGGNLYTILPMAVAARMGFEREWKQAARAHYSFDDKKRTLVRWVELLSSEPVIAARLAFDPPVPETNMVHVYLKDCTVEECTQALELCRNDLPSVAKRFRVVEHNPAAVRQGYGVYFEWPVGMANGRFSDTTVRDAWLDFCQQLELVKHGN